MNRDFDYENNNIGYDYQYTESMGGGIKCKNFILCGTILPRDWFECKSHYLCVSCDCMFGTWGNPETEFSNNGKGVLDVIENVECMICFKTKNGLSLPKCYHSVCIDCFKRMYYGDDSGEPEFPYPEIQEEYYNDMENPKWNMDYPLIAMYDEKWEQWDLRKLKKYREEQYLRQCPLCKK